MPEINTPTKPPMCGVNMLMNMVKLIVEPMNLYQSTVNSVYFPLNSGMNEGSFSSVILALTSSKTRPCEDKRSERPYRIDELNN